MLEVFTLNGKTMFSAFMKLNKNLKIAIFVAPILIILGWAASDIWIQSQAMKVKVFELIPESSQCDIVHQQCVLRSGDFKIDLYQDGSITTLNSTFPLDTATLFLVDEYNQPSVFQMGMKVTPYYWYQVTPLPTLLANQGSAQKMRLIATVKGGQYIAEFVTRTQ